MSRPQTRIAIVALALALVPSLSVARADGMEDFFHGQTITLVIGSDPGGGYDAYARPVARHLGSLIPGHPTIVVKYMSGAAGLVAANYIYASAPRDGLTIGAMQRQIPVEPLRGDDAARYDPFKMNWLGSVTAETSVLMVWKTAPQQKAQDLLTMPLIAASLGTGTDSQVESIAMQRLLGAPIKLISGYVGTPDALLALQRGEGQAIHGISWSYVKTQKADWLHDGSIRLLLQSGLKPNPEIKDVPSIYDLVKPEDRQVWDLVLAPKAMSRPYVLPPDVPAERVATLRKAFDQLMTDPGFLADMNTLKLEVAPISGIEIENLMKTLYAAPPAAVAKMRAAIAP